MKTNVYLVYETKTAYKLPCGVFDSCSLVSVYLGCSPQSLYNAFSASKTNEIILHNYGYGIIRIRL